MSILLDFFAAFVMAVASSALLRERPLAQHVLARFQRGDGHGRVQESWAS